MKKYKIITILLIFIIPIIRLNAGNALHLGFSAGLAIPNAKVSQFFDEAKQNLEIKTLTILGDYILDKAANTGYSLKILGRLELSEHFTFVPSVGLLRFNEGLYDLVVPIENGDTAHAKAQSTANVVPISVGLNGYLFRGFLSPYVNVDLVYNFIKYSYDIFWYDDFAVPIYTSRPLHRLGYSVGAGVDIDLALVSLNVEAKFSMINIIRYNEQEPTKDYFSLSVGIIF